MTRSNAQFRPDEELEEELKERQKPEESIGQTARRDIERYYAILRADRPALTLNQWHYILDMLNGTITPPPQLMHVVRYEVLDAADDGLPGKWRINHEELAQLLTNLPLSSYTAIWDLAERYWNAISRGREPNLPQLITKR